MSIVGGLDIHRQQITFDYLDTDTGEVSVGQIPAADRRQLRAWLARRFGHCEDRGQIEFSVEGCTGWRYVAEELAAAGMVPHLAEPAETANLRGRKKRAKTDRADARHQRDLLLQGRLPECWIPPAEVLEARALLGCYHDLRRDHTAWVQRIHAVLFHQGATPCTDLGTTAGRENLAKVAAEQLSPAGRVQVAAAVLMLEATEAQMGILHRQPSTPPTPINSPLRTADDAGKPWLRLVSRRIPVANPVRPDPAQWNHRRPQTLPGLAGTAECRR